MAGIGLTKVFGMPGQQANEEVDPAEVTAVNPASQDQTSGSISMSYRPAIHLMLYALAAITKLHEAKAAVSG
jgi:hypothetical protein